MAINQVNYDRWNSPFPYTIAFNLYKKHFTELNNVYWSFVPASNKIKRLLEENLADDSSYVKHYFEVSPDEERRAPMSFGQWKEYYSNYENYSRLNMVMLLSSCFETYLRTVTAHAFESKPGVLIGCPEAIDGVSFLKTRPYYDLKHKDDYMFRSQVESITKGEWKKRFKNFEKYFGVLPQTVRDKRPELDKFRNLRNDIGHYLGREKDKYAAPMDMKPIDAISVTHDELLGYFKLVYNVAKDIDTFLQSGYIGSYDVIKCFWQEKEKGNCCQGGITQQARDFQKRLGEEGLIHRSTRYHINIVNIFAYGDSNDDCRYSRTMCVSEVRRRLQEKGVVLKLEGNSVTFTRALFNMFVRANQWEDDPEYHQRCENDWGQLENRYSMRLIERIVELISGNPDGIIELLKNAE